MLQVKTENEPKKCGTTDYYFNACSCCGSFLGGSYYFDRENPGIAFNVDDKPTTQVNTEFQEIVTLPLEDGTFLNMKFCIKRKE